MADAGTRLRSARRRLLAVALVAAVRLSLSLLPYRVAHRWFDRSPGPAAVPDVRHGRGIACEIRRASRLVPRATCLIQALAARAWLAQRGIASDLRLGVARKPDGSPEAHAWVEVGGHVVLGELPDLGRFARMPAADDREARVCPSASRT